MAENTASHHKNSDLLQINTKDRCVVSPLTPSRPSLSSSRELRNFRGLVVDGTGENIGNDSLFVTASSPSTEGQPYDHSDTSRSGSYYRVSSSSISPASLVITPVTSRAPSDHDPVDEGPTQKPNLSSLITSSLVVCTRPVNSAREDDTGNPGGNVERFVPDDAIERLICPELVYNERPDITQEQLDDIFTNRQRLFAILTMMDLAELIAKLAIEKIDDSCLPFRINGSGNLEYRSSTSDTREVTFLPVHCLNDKIGVLYLFDTFQWHFLAPNLAIDCPCDGYLDSTTVEHRRFQREVRIPFVKITPASTFCDPERSRHEVAKAYVHPAHRNACRHSPSHEPDPCHWASCCAGPFAVKIISVVRRAEALNEMGLLRRFDCSGERYRHRIIRLLCSFEYDSNYYLIFPHADANLWQFWKDKYPRRANPPRGPGLTRWVAGEILGLVRGLQLIHNPPAAPDNKKPSGQLNGRHGDLKPENILWFKNEFDDYLSSDSTDDKDRMPLSGILKICDFDTAVIHGDDTVSNNNDSRYLVKTDAYSAPESAIKGSISQEYDSWSLGCILLQFVTWYALGWEGVKALEATIRQHATRSPVHILGCPVPMARFFDIDSSTGEKKGYLIPTVEQVSGQ
ncbi:Protein kinase-like domain containing protein [Rhypophila decipiens]